MSEPDGPDATRRTLIRGAVVLGAVGVGAGLSRLGEGTYDIATTSSESDIATQTTPAETAAPAEPTPSAKPKKTTKSDKTTKSAKSDKPAASAEPSKTTKSAKADSADSADSTKSAKSDKPAKTAKAPKPAGKELGPANKVPVGGGAIYKSDRIVVTQPKAGEYKAFDALCTHANCLVDQVKAGVIHCPCHSAKFSAADGSVIKPSVARRPLNPKGTVTEADGKLYLT